MANRKRAILLSLGLLACAEAPPQESPPVMLGRVGETEISARDFTLALAKLPTGIRAKTLDDWRRQFQVLVDKELLLFEARAQDLDRTVAATVATWERNQLVEELLAREMGEALVWTEAELAAFFSDSNAGREIRLSRLMLVDKTRALEALKKAQSGTDFAALAATYGRTNWSESGWLNALNAGDARLAALFLLEVGAVELIEADGQFLVLGIAAERQVQLVDRRPLVEAALEQRKKQRANLAYLEHLTGKYAVRLDTSALRQVVVGQSQPGLRLVSSTLGDWSLNDYNQALGRLRAGTEPLPADVTALGFKVTRAFVADRLLREEATHHGLYPELETRREKLRQQKLIKALWDREIFAKIQIDPAELSAFYETNKERYADLGENKAALQNQVVQDLRDAKAAPLFDRYIEQLRQKHASIVSIEEELLGEFVSRRRQAASPVDL
jgi:hypothetical protein